MISFQDFKKLDIRVSEIKAVENHPNADKLLVMQVKVGDEERQLVAGLKGHYEPDELQGKKIVIVANLEPAVLRGEKSEGMLLAATDGDNIVIPTPECDVASGSSVS